MSIPADSLHTIISLHRMTAVAKLLFNAHCGTEESDRCESTKSVFSFLMSMIFVTQHTPVYLTWHICCCINDSKEGHI